MRDKKLIEAFGDANEIVAAFAQRGVPITRSAVYQWKRRGVAPRWRDLLAAIAETRGIAVPRGFANGKKQAA